MSNNTVLPFDFKSKELKKAFGSVCFWMDAKMNPVLIELVKEFNASSEQQVRIAKKLAIIDGGDPAVKSTEKKRRK